MQQWRRMGIVKTRRREEEERIQKEGMNTNEEIHGQTCVEEREKQEKEDGMDTLQKIRRSYENEGR